jgi:hypothetical protein
MSCMQSSPVLSCNLQEQHKTNVITGCSWDTKSYCLYRLINLKNRQALQIPKEVPASYLICSDPGLTLHLLRCFSPLFFFPQISCRCFSNPHFFVVISFSFVSIFVITLFTGFLFVCYHRKRLFRILP